MALTGSRCKLTTAKALLALADLGSVRDVQRHLTDMLRCSGKLGCAEAVPCSDQAVELLRSLVLPAGEA